MTSPPEEVTVKCPQCAHTYADWHRASLNLGLDDFDEAYVREASTATCPRCGHTVELGTLVVEDGVWRFPN